MPSQLGAMTSLTSVDLADNKLTGSIPSQLAALNKLNAYTVPLWQPFDWGSAKSSLCTA
jgi:hypothetical protein